MNFDFLFENKTDAGWELTDVEFSVFDRNGNLVRQKAARSGLGASLPRRFVVDPKKTKILPNPLYAFHSPIDPARLDFEFFFREEKEGAARLPAERIVSPVPYQTKTKLIPPLGGRISTYEGHDLYAHRRRVDLAQPIVARLGASTNPTRRGYDFRVADENGSIFRAEGETNDDRHGFGAPVVAPAGGGVKEVRNAVEDNVLGRKTFDFNLVFQDIKAFYGNYVVVDHQNGEVGLLLHLKKGSVAVKSGDKIKTGQTIAQKGISGDSEYVHPHYQLQNSAEINNETFPVHFQNFRRRRGEASEIVKSGALETGDFIESLHK